MLTFRKSTTKGKLKTRVVDIQAGLAELLADYQPRTGILFPGLRGVTERQTRFAADKILRDACKPVGLVGVRSFNDTGGSIRRTASPYRCTRAD